MPTATACAGAQGGIDPNDARWDSDGDTLADGFELARRQEGQDFSPQVCDTDGDGLPDVQEAEYGANPNSRDTDNDGLNDNVEIRHRVMNCTNGKLVVTNNWAGGVEIMIAPGGMPITTAVTSPLAVRVWVSSNATLADADADGIPDDAEYELATSKLPNSTPDWFARLDPDGNLYNPNVRNASPLQVFVTTDARTGYVKPGQTVAYTTTVSQLIKFGDGVLEVTVPAALGGGPRLTALPQNATAPISITARSNLAVAAGTASGTVLPLLSTARARTAPAAADAWSWFQPGSDKLNNGQSSSRGLDVAASRADRADAYLVSGITANASGTGSRGDVVAYPLPAGTARTVESDSQNTTFLRADDPSSTACTTDGKCMVVWDQINNCGAVTLNQFTLTAEGKDHVTSGAEIRIYFAQDGGPNPLPTDLVWSKLWSWNDENWLDMDTGTVVGPNAHGLPKQLSFCNPNDPGSGKNYYSRLQVWESDSDGQEDVGHVDVRLDRYTPDNTPLPFDLGPSYKDSDNNGVQVRVNFTVPQQQRYLLAGAITDPQANLVAGQFNLVSPVAAANIGDATPAIASDGQNFLVVWNRKTVQKPGDRWRVSSSLLGRLFAKNGGALTGVITLADPVVTEVPAGIYIGADEKQLWDWDEAFASNTPDLIPSVVWAGDRYRVVWSQLLDANTKTLLSRDVYANGAIVPDSAETISAYVSPTATARNQPPQLAYDPVNEKFMALYINRDGNLSTRLYAKDGSSLSGNTQTLPGVTRPTRATVAYYPSTQGWLLTAEEYLSGNISYRALDGDGNTMLDGPAPIAFGNVRMACPAPASTPMIALPFEELPGATRFLNAMSGGNTYDAHCTAGTCPLVGIAGVGRAGLETPNVRIPPSTDRALLFDGVNDRVWLNTPLVSDFTVSMWLKTTQPGTGQFWWQGDNILYGDVQGLTRRFGLSIGNGGKVLFGVGDLSTSLTGSRVVNDGQWHHVVATRSGVTGAFAVYVDGVLAGQNSKFAGPLDVSPTIFLGNLQAGVASFRGALDFLTIYGSAMQADAVLDLYQGELPSDLGYTPNPTACVLGGASTTGFPWARIGLERDLARGAGPLTSSAGVNLTVDSDKPTTTIALAEGQFFKAPANGGSAALIIGGSASDGSGVGVASVEVTANSVTARANGTETWAHTIELREGAITVQSTAVDFLGNRGNPGRTATIYGDGKPPVISASLPAEPFIPFRAGSGAWKAPISASVNDPTIGNGLPGSGEAKVEVLLRSADGAADLPGPGRVTSGQLVTGLRSSRGRGQPHRQLHRHHPLGRPRGQRQ